MTTEETLDMYDFEIGRFNELHADNPEYAFQRYGLTLLYSLPTEETFKHLQELGWKGKDPLDLYNEGTVQALEGNTKDAMKAFNKAEAAGCTQPELFFNMAIIFEEDGDADKAKEYYQKYIDISEQFGDLPRSLQEELDEVREHLKPAE